MQILEREEVGIGSQSDGTCWWKCNRHNSATDTISDIADGI